MLAVRTGALLQRLLLVSASGGFARLRDIGDAAALRTNVMWHAFSLHEIEPDRLLDVTTQRDRVHVLEALDIHVLRDASNTLEQSIYEIINSSNSEKSTYTTYAASSACVLNQRFGVICFIAAAPFFSGSMRHHTNKTCVFASAPRSILLVKWT